MACQTEPIIFQNPLTRKLDRYRFSFRVFYGERYGIFLVVFIEGWPDPYSPILWGRTFSQYCAGVELNPLQPTLGFGVSVMLAPYSLFDWFALLWRSRGCCGMSSCGRALRRDDGIGTISLFLARRAGIGDGGGRLPHDRGGKAS